jgi:type I restriction enzyme S subunit
MTNWKEYKLGELLGTKGYIRGPFGSALRRPEMKSEGYAVYEQQHAIYNTRDFRYFIDENKFAELNRFSIRANDLIISCSGTVGEVSIINEDDPQGIISQALLTLRPNLDLVKPQFLYYFFKTRNGHNQLLSASHGSVQVNIAKREVVESIPVSIPDIETQDSIIEILSSLDDKIELNNKINQELENLAQTLFKQWFIDFEFPNEKGEPYKSSGGEMVDSELGEIPKGWEVSEIGLVAKLGAGGDKPKIVSDVPTEEINVPIYSNGITNDGLYGYTDKAKIFEESVTISARGTIGFVCLRSTPFFPIVRLISAIADEKYISTKFLYMWLKNQNIYGNGTTQQQLTVPDFKSSKIIIPTLILVEEYTDQMNGIIENINFNKLENQELTNLRDTLLPKLISGELEVAEVMAEKA